MNKITDHLGQEFSSIKEICEHWNVKYTTYINRIERGYSIKDALERPYQNRIIKPNGIIKDHLGQEFSSVKEMCEHWNIKYVTYANRIKRGYSTKDALERPCQNRTIKPNDIMKDHLGQEFSSVKEMCEHWNIKRKIYFYRIKKGYSIKDALERPCQNRTIKPNGIIKDHLGREFPSIKAMCDYWNAPYRVFQTRIKKGNSLIEALSIIKPITNTTRNYRIDDHLTIIKCIDNAKNYFLCNLNSNDIIMCYDQIIKYCESHMSPNKNSYNG